MQNIKNKYDVNYDPIDFSIEIIQNADLVPLIHDSDVIVIFSHSSALFDAHPLEKPIYMMNMNIFDEVEIGSSPRFD